MNTQKLMNVDETAAYLGVKRSTIFAWSHTGFLPKVKLNRCLRFSRDDLDQFIDAHKEAGRSRKTA